MDIDLSTTGADASADIAAVDAKGDARIDALKAAATALLPAAGLSGTDYTEVSLAVSDQPGWAVIRIAKVIPEA